MDKFNKISTLNALKMTYFTLDDVKNLAREDGWSVDDKPYSYADDSILKAYLLFKYQITEDYEKIKLAVLSHSKSALDPDVKFIIKSLPRVGSYLPIICKVRPGLMLDKTEMCTFDSSIPLYTFDGIKYTQAPATFEINYQHSCRVPISCVPENGAAINIHITSEHLDEDLTISEIFPIKNPGEDGSSDPAEAESIIGLCKLGSAVML